MAIFKINKNLIAPKAHYFLFFGGMASFWPFITVFAKQLGVTEVPVGILFTIAPLTGLISMPLFGAIADRFKIKKKLFLFFNLVNFMAIMCFAVLPQSTTKRPVSLECGEGASFIIQDRTGLKNPAIWSKCNVSEAILSHSGHSLDSCSLTCRTTEVERGDLCQTLLGETTPSFCKNQEEEIQLQVKIKTSLAIIQEELLYLPINSVGEANQSYSCFERTELSSCEIECFTNPLLDLQLQKISDSSDSGTFLQGSFWTYAFLVLVTWIAFAVVTSVADALCFQTLGDAPHLYGLQRQWGAMGWGLFSLLAGALVDYFSQGSLIKDYTPCFYLIFVTLTLNFFVCCRWKVKEEEKPHALGKSVYELMTHPEIFVFILACIVVGLCTGVLWHFLFWYAEDIATCEHMKLIKILQGLISIVQCFGGELPFFYISSWFIKTFGHVHCMSIVLAAMGLRFLIYSFLYNPWLILPVELLQGVTYGIFYSNMASYAYVVSPPGSAATVQGIVGAAFEGIGVGTGSLVGGILYKEISGRITFRAIGIFTLLFCVVHVIVTKLITQNFSRVSQNEVEGYREGHSKLKEMINLKQRTDDDA